MTTTPDPHPSDPSPTLDPVPPRPRLDHEPHAGSFPPSGTSSLRATLLASAIALLCTAPLAHADEESTPSGGQAPTAAAEDPFAASGGLAVERVYRPAQAAFADAAGALETRVAALCTEANDEALAGTRDAFTNAVAAFSGIELLRAGPLLEDNRLNRLFYWPDTRRAGERQLRALLAEGPDEMEATPIPARSVAVQGLPALERLLYGDAAIVLAGGDDPSPAGRCRVAEAIALNVATTARTLDEAWSGEDGIAREMRSPRADDPLFRSSEEVVRRLLTQLETGLGILVDRKAGPLLDAEPPRLRGAPFTRSGETWTNLAGNIGALRALAIDTALAARAGLENELAFEFRVAAAHTARLAELAAEGAPSDVLNEEEIGVLRALVITLTSIRTTLNERLLPSLGVRTGFNAEDGD